MSKTDTMPPLPAGAVDFNALDDALKAGDSPEKAIEKATPKKTEAQPVRAPVATKPSPVPAPASKPAAKSDDK